MKLFLLFFLLGGPPETSTPRTVTAEDVADTFQTFGSFVEDLLEQDDERHSLLGASQAAQNEFDKNPTTPNAKTANAALQALACSLIDGLENDPDRPPTFKEIIKTDIQTFATVPAAANGTRVFDKIFDSLIFEESGTIEVFSGFQPVYGTIEVAQDTQINLTYAPNPPIEGTFEVTIDSGGLNRAASQSQTDVGGSTQGALSMNVQRDTRITITFQPAAGGPPKEKIIDFRVRKNRVSP